MMDKYSGNVRRNRNGPSAVWPGILVWLWRYVLCHRLLKCGEDLASLD